MDDELIQLKEVSKKFGKNQVLDAINLTIPEKEIVGIIGASGEGKTTILKLLVGFYKPTKGEVTYLRKNINREMGDIEKLYGFATEDGSFYEKLSVKENIFHFGKLYGLKNNFIKERYNELIRLVGLSAAANTLAENLSIGMKKRLDIACALVHNPQVLIMDEPTADLDPLLRKNMLNLIRDINKKGTTIVLTTQLMQEVDEICDRIAILFNKKIIEEGDPKKIKQKYGKSNIEGVFTKIFSQKRDEIEKENESKINHLVKRIKNLKKDDKHEIIKKIKEIKDPEAEVPKNITPEAIEKVLREHADEEAVLPDDVLEVIEGHLENVEEESNEKLN